MENVENSYGGAVPAEVYDAAALLLRFITELDEIYGREVRGETNDERPFG